MLLEHSLDYLLHLCHILIILINLFGWLSSKTLKLNLFFLGGTLFSWSVLGLFYGFGYCPFTDWQWRIKESLGETDLPASYIKYMADRIFSINSDPVLIDRLTFVAYFFALIISIVLNIRRTLWKGR